MGFQIFGKQERRIFNRSIPPKKKNAQAVSAKCHSLWFGWTINLRVIVIPDRFHVLSGFNTLNKQVDWEVTSIRSRIGWVVHIWLSDVIEEFEPTTGSDYTDELGFRLKDLESVDDVLIRRRHYQSLRPATLLLRTRGIYSLEGLIRNLRGTKFGIDHLPRV